MHLRALRFSFAITFIVAYCDGVVSQTKLLTRQVTNYGVWSEIEYCPWGTYIVGLSVKSQSGGSDLLGLTGLKLYCSQVPIPGPLIASSTPFITSGTLPTGEFGKIEFCLGAIFGFQLKVEAYQGPHGDDTGINNIRLLCNNGRYTYRLETEAVLGSFGAWREVYTCPEDELLCGVETQIDIDPSSDGTGLNNVNFVCCPVMDLNETETATIQTQIEEHISQVNHGLSNGIHLQSQPFQELDPEYTVWGEEVFCPIESKVVGVQLSRIIKFISDDTIVNLITDISFLCGRMRMSPDEKIVISSAGLSFVNTSSLQLVRRNCSGNSYAVGLQLYHDPTNFNIERVDLLCRYDNNETEKIPFEIYEAYETGIDGGSVEFPSIPMEPMECQASQFLCGLKTQIFHDDEQNPEYLGIKNIKLKCCDSPPRGPIRRPGRKSRKQIPLQKTNGMLEESRYVLRTPIVKRENSVDSLWRRCSPGHYLTGLGLKYVHEQAALTGLQLQCANDAAQQEDFEFLDIPRYSDPSSIRNESCEVSGYATGIQVKSRPKYGEDNNVTLEVLDVRLTCEDDVSSGNWDSHELSSGPNVTHEGLWMGQLECRRDEVLCGIQIIANGGGLPFITGVNSECCERTVGLNVSTTGYGSMLKNRRVAGRILHSLASGGMNHKWSSWDYCSDDHYVAGFGTKRLPETVLITGLKLLCLNPTSPEETWNAVAMETIGTLELPVGKYQDDNKCPGGVAIGMQLSYRNNSVQGLRFLCSWGSSSANNFTENTNAGAIAWTVPQKCPVKSTICGFQTSFGDFGLNGLGIKCCKVPHPAEACIPNDKWELVTSHDNRKGTSALNYQVTRRVGLTITHEIRKSQVLEKSFAESLGYQTELSKGFTDSRSSGTQTDNSVATNNQKSNEISANQALSNSMTKSSAHDTSKVIVSGSDHRESQNSHVSNTKGSESSSSSGSGHTAGGGGGFGMFGISLSAKYDYNTNSEKRDSKSSGSTSGSSSSSDKGRHESTTGSEGNSNRDETGTSSTKTWANAFTKLASDTKTTTNSTNVNRQSTNTDTATDAKSKNSNSGITERIDWTSTDSRVWQVEESETVNMNIRPGVKMEYYQGVGRCSFYEIRSKLFRRVDTVDPVMFKIFNSNDVGNQDTD